MRQQQAAELLRVLRQPARLTSLSPDVLGEVLRGLARAGLLAHLGQRLTEDVLPLPLQDRFEAARVFAADNERRLRLGLQLARQALGDMPVVVLKGGAYLLEGFGNARGRLVSDLDLMVPKARLAEAEGRLLQAGWRSKPEDGYEDHYYRAWMHELPPLQHGHHDLTLDLHHTISPPSGRLRLDADSLFERAVPLPGDTPFLRLGDEDLVLHLCIHSFHDGELHAGLRELVDLDGVLRAVSGRPGFWQRLLDRAGQVGALRSLYYATRFAESLLQTPIPAEARQRLAGNAPLPPLRRLLDWAMLTSLMPDTDERPGWRRRLAQTLVLVRAHWLRMPPLMLLGHLLTQVRRRGGLRTKQAAARSAQ